jgi:hypothetical protein
MPEAYVLAAELEGPGGDHVAAFAAYERRFDRASAAPTG